MSSLVKGIFGGTDDSGQKAQIRANERTQRFIEEQAGLARDDVNRLLPMAADSARSGYESAFGLMQGIAPQQIDAIRQGNISAQENLLAGLPQMQAALLGGPVDNSVFQISRMGEGMAAPLQNAAMPERQQMIPEQQPVDQQQLIQQLLGGLRFPF